jgi:Putative lumazine-binding
MAANRSPADSEARAIRKTVLDYLESCYSWEGYRMKRALHPKLAKRVVWTNPKTGRSRMWEYPASKLVHDVQAGWGGRKAHSRRTPVAERQTDITILDRFKDMGVVKTEASWGIDYIQLAKYNGRWKIINVLWRHKTD